MAKYKAESKMHGIDEWSAEIHSKFGRHEQQGHSGSLSPSAAAAAAAAGAGAGTSASGDRLGQAVGQGRVLLDDGTDSLVGGAPAAGGAGAGRDVVAATPRASGGAKGAKQRALEKNLMALRSAQLSQEDSDEAIASIDRVLVSRHDGVLACCAPCSLLILRATLRKTV